MGSLLLMTALIILGSCSRPDAPPPVTPAQPPTVETKLETTDTRQ